MALTTFEGGRPRAVARSTTGGGDVLTEITPPAWARSLTIRFVGASGKLAHSGTDGAALGAGAYEDLPSDTDYRVPITEGRDASQRARVFVTSSSAGATFSVVAEARE